MSEGDGEVNRLGIIRLFVWVSLIAPSHGLPGGAHAAEDEPQSEEERTLEDDTELEGGGAAASDPTASVNFQDIRYRYFDLEGDNHKNSFEAEGSYVFNPRFKVSHKLIGVETDVTGKSEADFSELSLKPIFLTPMKPFGIKAKLALGVEWLKDLGESSEGTGSGSDQIAPLVGVGWLLTEEDFVITLAQYFHSYDEDSGVEDVRRTGPRLIYIRKLPRIKGWAKVDFKGQIDHEDGNDFTQTLELQLGTMITPSIGIYGELLLGDTVFDTNAYDIGGGAAIRIVY
jgi:hypothetical protein